MFTHLLYILKIYNQVDHFRSILMMIIYLFLFQDLGHSNSTYNNGESGSAASASNYQASLFATTYKQLTISNQQASIQDLPFSSIASAPPAP